LGNEWVHLLTTNTSYRLRFDLVTYDHKWAHAEYSTFWIGSESDNYRLHVSGYSGNAGNALLATSYNNENGQTFKTTDRNKRTGCCCGGWWDAGCGLVRLTGRYELYEVSFHSVVWYPFSKRLAYADMKIQRND
ncbi:hypothetical protein LSH36_1558g00003, partial [Paralvinella palmiformis]